MTDFLRMFSLTASKGRRHWAAVICLLSCIGAGQIDVVVGQTVGDELEALQRRLDQQQREIESLREQISSSIIRATPAGVNAVGSVWDGGSVDEKWPGRPDNSVQLSNFDQYFAEAASSARGPVCPPAGSGA